MFTPEPRSSASSAWKNRLQHCLELGL